MEMLIDGVDLKNLPKVLLHDHLDGGVRAKTIIELGQPLGLELPSKNPEELGRWFLAQSDSGELTRYLASFDITGAVMQTAEGLRRVAQEAVEDLAADGVVYAELRWAPAQHLGGGLDLDTAVEVVQAGLDEATAQLRDAGRDIRVQQLLCAMRQNPDDALGIAELALRHRDNGVAGFDAAGPEAGFPASSIRDAFDLVANNFLPITVHAGEAAGLDSIRGALLDGRALRLGHGVRIAEDLTVESEDDETSYVTLGTLAEWVKDRRIPLETSPSSNLHTGAIAQWGKGLDAHPFDLLYQLGFAVTVNTDNRLMSATTASRELWRLADAFDYDLDDLLAFQLNAAEAAFLPLDEREALADLIEEGFSTAVRAVR